MFEIDREIRTGETRQVHDLEITPQTNVFSIRTRGSHFGFIWNRPRSVIVRTADGQETILPVRDVTRYIIWGILAGGVLGAMMIGMMHHMNTLGNSNKE